MQAIIFTKAKLLEMLAIGAAKLSEKLATAE
jgi:hypothetical protein